MSHRSASQNAENQSELLNELAHRVEWLCRSCPDDLRGAAAHDELVNLRPRVQEAIEAPEDIKERRGLTEEELAWRRVFKLLLNARR